MSDMASQLESIVDAIEGVSTQILFSLILFELVILFFRRKWRAKDSWVSLACYGLGFIPYILFFAVLQFEAMMWLYDHARIFTFGDAWYVWALCFLCFDLAWWAVHFAAHKVRFLWCIHGAHHTSNEMNMSVSIRGSFFDFFQYVHLVIWLPILGFHPFMVFSVEIISRLYGVVTHMHKDFVPHTPFLDKILITPSLHHVHHARNPLYIDTNFANMFAFWDRLWGTHRLKEKNEEPVFGVTDADINGAGFFSSQFGLWKILIDDIRSTPKWSDKLKYIFMPPGWHPLAGTSLPLTVADRELA